MPLEVSTTPPEAVARSATLLAVAADPLRWRLLRLLEAGPTCVCELQRACDVPANLLSYHLRVLREADLVTASRRGRWIDYALAEDAGTRLAAALPIRAGAWEVGDRS
ncbi:ArsR/SmtB family transcription factor [Nocardioides ferulae]|uniref:ArsR/SmtB family transcription factor n=1 Tax=Nocardioides ferulae TaxID=2340821 RepID=UPI000EAF772C|nr:helix-turn-helix domain-containing protein [Nocardioides ferulae]